MRENTLRSSWQQGQAVINGWLAIPSTWTAEVMAHQGWDSLTIDVQHGVIDYQLAVNMLQAISSTPVTPTVRVPWNEPGVIMKMLDAGAYGIICPMINSRAEAESFIGACRYPPLGYRSYGPTRAGLAIGGDYFKNASTTVVTFAMIETAQAVKNVEEIVSTPGLDGIYIGPSDLNISLGGGPRGILTEPHLAEAIKTVVTATKKYGVVAGIHTSSVEDALRVIEMGFRFVTILSDSALLSTAAQAMVNAVKTGQATPGPARGAAGPY